MALDYDYTRTMKEQPIESVLLYRAPDQFQASLLEAC